MKRRDLPAIEAPANPPTNSILRVRMFSSCRDSDSDPRDRWRGIAPAVADISMNRIGRRIIMCLRSAMLGDRPASSYPHHTQRPASRARVHG
jgi:hypothetical protein